MDNKSFDCVKMQRNIRDKFVKEAEMDLNKFFDLIKSKNKTGEVYKKLSERLEKEKQLKTA